MSTDKRFYRRSALRLKIGAKYFIMKRRVKWFVNKKIYSKNRCKELLKYRIFNHKTPLLRKLKDVDMWMQYNKVNNLRIAIENLDGVIIRPGEVFSYWKLIGRPTKSKGYKEGMSLINGTVKSTVGGGLCQLSNLIYWMTLHTPLKVIERYRHGFDYFPDSNRTQPFGSGATCSYNYIDLQIKNITDEEYQLCLKLDDTHLIGEWRSTNSIDYKYEVYEKNHKITHEFWGDYLRHNIIFRKVYDLSNNQIGDEFVTENHAVMVYSPFLAEKAGA